MYFKDNSRISSNKLCIEWDARWVRICKSGVDSLLGVYQLIDIWVKFDKFDTTVVFIFLLGLECLSNEFSTWLETAGSHTLWKNANSLLKCMTFPAIAIVNCHLLYSKYYMYCQYVKGSVCFTLSKCWSNVLTHSLVFIVHSFIRPSEPLQKLNKFNVVTNYQNKKIIQWHITCKHTNSKIKTFITWLWLIKRYGYCKFARAP